MSRLLAHRVNSRQRSTWVAFGAKRTLTEPRLQKADFWVTRRLPRSFNANELTHHSLLCRGHRPSLHWSIIISLPLGPGRNDFGRAVVRVRTAKSAVASDHFLHAHFVGWQTAIVMKGMARISARAPRHLSGLADAKVEQHCHRYSHYDEH